MRRRSLLVSIRLGHFQIISGSNAMKRFVLVSSLILGFGSDAFGKQAAEARAPEVQNAGGLSAETRMKALEEEVRTLAEEVAVLRGELKAVRDAKSAEPASDPRILLTAAHVEPGMLPANPPLTAASASPGPAPASPQVAQTQTYGGATSNAKLLNPDISLIGD